ncbi:nitrogen fixation protein NifZ [Novosphingobium album (ex Liu et al. 2023)]|uniref:Nitrogen fixation protein NifZ n=1 Tax=Novosphingobium album (ex Liu et al. 2023) TaxID=3031130 RepID=A0ABT5WQA6_9SPHN|nr:nitrogen fixation protein NifZ [Novosphingobium album (ex Liu et al. 2023)]MDE8652222.1 nitrogen fixation protein NifZ [Novosphingobium album (ex Liu et al. 2023)]
MDLREPLFRWGEKVRAVADLVNDGSHPGWPPEALLAAAGTHGEIVNVGHHGDSNTPVYLVEFDGQMVVGCFEEELARA